MQREIDRLRKERDQLQDRIEQLLEQRETEREQHREDLRRIERKNLKQQQFNLEQMREQHLSLFRENIQLRLELDARDARDAGAMN